MSENLRPAGQPSIEARKMDAGRMSSTPRRSRFSAVEVKSLEDLAIEKPVGEVGDADIDDICRSIPQAAGAAGIR